jgi:hypothetical protein
MRVEGEARRAFTGGAWDGVVGSGRAAFYLKPSPAITLITSVEGAGGWDARLPLGLALGDRDGGMRGVDRDQEEIGARRLVGRFEPRWSLGHLKRRADVGLALFTDVGRLWAGDIPYGSSTRTVATAGFSVLATVPHGAQRLWRLDVGTVVRGGREAREWEVRVSSSDFTRTFWQEPARVTRARSAAGVARLLSWP